MNLKNIFKHIQPISHEKFPNTDLEFDSMKTHKYTIGNEWNQISRYHKIDIPLVGQSISTGQSAGQPT